MAAHFRRNRLAYLAGPVAGVSVFTFGVLLGTAAAAPLGQVVPAPSQVEIGTAIQVTRDNPVPHPPPVVAPPPRPVAKVASPCSAKRGQLKAVEAELVTVYRTPSALELAEDAGTIARALFVECGWEGR